MAKTDTPSHDSFKAAVQAFIQERLEAKLDKLKDDDPKREEERSKYLPAVWIEDAARRVQQIQAVTHSLKPIHPDARGTNLYVEPDSLPALAELGSHALGKDFAPDVTGAAALDVYKFLKLQVGERSLLTALQKEDPAAMQVLHDDAAQAKALRDKLVGLTQPGSGEASSHSRAKQLYWLTGSDATADSAYELLAPLFATSLAQRVYDDVEKDRFGETNKAARQAWHERKAYDGVFVDYPELAMQKMGGDNTQNISQLNVNRGGVNYLLASLPPIWKVSEQRLPVNADSVFNHLYPQRSEVRKTMRGLLQFLEEDPGRNQPTRKRRAAYVETLMDELVNLAGQLRQGLPAGWTLNDKRFHQLARVEQLWLDPWRAEFPDEDDFAEEWLRLDWPAAIVKRFGNWLNAQFEGRLLVGDDEAREWQRALSEDDGWREALAEQRRRIHKQRGQR